MGAGKTTVGKILSKKLGYDFVDMDTEIEITHESAISDIFKNHGEEYFRDIETQMLRDISTASNRVVSTGGGVVIRDENWQIMKDTGTTVYLKASIETLFNRVKHRTTRPLLNVENPFETAKELFQNREPLYEKSDVIIDREGLEPERVAEAVIEQVQK